MPIELLDLKSSIATMVHAINDDDPDRNNSFASNNRKKCTVVKENYMKLYSN